MRKLFICLLLLATLLPADDEKSKSEKSPETILLDFSARREEGLILIDGVVHINEIADPLIGLRIRFELFAPGNKLISQKKLSISEQLLEKGDEVPFYVKCSDHPRATAIKVIVRSKRQMFLTLENDGPYGIE